MARMRRQQPPVFNSRRISSYVRRMVGRWRTASPRWYADRLSKALPADQFDYLVRALNRIESEGFPDGLVRTHAVSNHRMLEMRDNDLLHLVFGVTT